MATRLQDAGYRTGLFGKCLNGYNTMEVPPGWDRWFAHVNGIDYYDYQINDDGTIKHYESTSADYETDVIAIFTSDNGWHEGEHRIQQGKWRPYEEDIHMPLVVRGPGVAAGSTTYKLVLNTDYLPTFMDLAGEQSPHYVDGRSLRPVLNESVTSWRSAILLEAAANYSPAYYGIRTVSTNGITRRKYVEYAGGARELYNLESDTYELTNSYDAAAPPTSLAMRLQA